MQPSLSALSSWAPRQVAQGVFCNGNPNNVGQGRRFKKAASCGLFGFIASEGGQFNWCTGLIGGHERFHVPLIASARANFGQITQIRAKMTISVDTQIRYLVQWFREWSELQRGDFLPVAVEKLGDKVYVNGIVESIANVNCQDKPMSLFQCRIKLFKEWIPQWSTDHKDNFLKQIADIDPSFGEKVQSELQNGVPHAETNGISEEVLED